MKKGVKIAIGIGVLGGTGFALWKLIKHFRNGKTDKLQINFVRSLNGLAFVNIINIGIPAIQQAFYKETSREQIKNKLAEIASRYGAYIRNAADITGVPYKIIQSFIFIESAGENTAQNGLSYGLMQVSTNSATDLLYSAKKSGLLNDKTRKVLQSYLGARLDTIEKMQYMNQYGLQVTASDLTKPELNILIGSLYLRMLIDHFTEGKSIRFDKVVACYNMGFGWRTKLAGPDYASIEKMVANLNTTTSSYILKLLGKNGTLDILTA